MEYKTVTVIIPTYNEEKYIGGCLESVVNQDYPAELMEVLVIDGGSGDNTREIIGDYSQKYPFIKLVDNPKRKQVYAFNRGIELGVGDYFIIMGAHSVYDRGYVKKSVELLKTTEAKNVGGVMESVGEGYISEAIALAMSSPFGVGNAHFRYRKDEAFVDTVFGGAWSRETLQQLNGFNEEYIVNQDYEINYRLRKAGGKILLSPEIKCKYFVRSSIKKLARQYFTYGKWKVKTIKEHPESTAFRQVVPPLFVLSLLASVTVFPFNRAAGLAIPVIYLLFILFGSVKISAGKGFKYLFVMPFILAVIHLSFGAGFLSGLFRFGIPGIGRQK